MQVNVVSNTEKKGVELHFNSKPDTKLRQHMKENGWQCARRDDRYFWYKKDSDLARRFIYTLEDFDCLVINNGQTVATTMDGLIAILQKADPFAELVAKAHDAGLVAANNCQPIPMIVQEHASPLDDHSEVKKEWFVSEGVCGFSWITIRPATQPFARWMKRERNSLNVKYNGVINFPDRLAYGGGLQIWVSGFNQSMQRKEKYADAFAAVLQADGIRASSGSRMD